MSNLNLQVDIGEQQKLSQEEMQTPQQMPVHQGMVLAPEQHQFTQWGQQHQLQQQELEHSLSQQEQRHGQDQGQVVCGGGNREKEKLRAELVELRKQAKEWQAAQMQTSKL